MIIVKIYNVGRKKVVLSNYFLNNFLYLVNFVYNILFVFKNCLIYYFLSFHLLMFVFYWTVGFFFYYTVIKDIFIQSTNCIKSLFCCRCCIEILFHKVRSSKNVNVVGKLSSNVV